jgi:hypothetical protein
VSVAPVDQIIAVVDDGLKKARPWLFAGFVAVLVVPPLLSRPYSEGTFSNIMNKLGDLFDILDDYADAGELIISTFGSTIGKNLAPQVNDKILTALYSIFNSIQGINGFIKIFRKLRG